MNNLKIILTLLKVFKWLIIAGTLFASVFILFLQEELVIQGEGLIDISSETLKSSVNEVLNLDDEMKFTVGTIQSELPPTPALRFGIILSAILVGSYLVFILQMIIHLVRDIRNKASFSPKNIDRLKQIAWLIILAPVLKAILTSVYIVIIGSQYELPPGLTFSWNGDLDLAPVAIGLLIYAIAVAFGEGLKLQNEQDLTI